MARNTTNKYLHNVKKYCELLYREVISLGLENGIINEQNSTKLFVYGTTLLDDILSLNTMLYGIKG